MEGAVPHGYRGTSWVHRHTYISRVLHRHTYIWRVLYTQPSIECIKYTPWMRTLNKQLEYTAVYRVYLPARAPIRYLLGHQFDIVTGHSLSLGTLCRKAVWVSGHCVSHKDNLWFKLKSETENGSKENSEQSLVYSVKNVFCSKNVFWGEKEHWGREGV